jgi:hypothetical protein
MDPYDEGEVLSVLHKVGTNQFATTSTSERSLHYLKTKTKLTTSIDSTGLIAVSSISE